MAAPLPPETAQLQPTEMALRADLVSLGQPAGDFRINLSEALESKRVEMIPR